MGIARGPLQAVQVRKGARGGDMHRWHSTHTHSPTLARKRTSVGILWRGGKATFVADHLAVALAAEAVATPPIA